MAACGRDFTVAVIEDGELLAWGDGGDGHLGLDDVLHQQQPARAGGEMSDNQRIRLTAAGRFHLAVMAEDGAVYTCGNGANGQLGLGDGQPRRQNSLFAILTEHVLQKYESSTGSIPLTSHHRKGSGARLLLVEEGNHVKDFAHVVVDSSGLLQLPVFKKVADILRAQRVHGGSWRCSGKTVGSVGTRIGVVAAASDVIRLLPAKTSVSCACAPARLRSQ